MSRYVDVDKLIEYAEKRKLQGVPVDVIKSKATADVEEVRHGKWIEKDGYCCCSFCNSFYGNPSDKYCSDCGAKMDGGKE